MLTCPGPPAGPTTTRPWTPTLIVRSPPRTRHSRAIWTKLPWWRRPSAEFSAFELLTDSVAAPWRYSTLGQLMSDAAGAAASELPDGPKKYDFTRPVNEESDGAAGGEPPPLTLPNGEQPASAVADASAQAAFRQPPRRDAPRQVLTLTMRYPRPPQPL